MQLSQKWRVRTDKRGKDKVTLGFKGRKDHIRIKMAWEGFPQEIGIAGGTYGVIGICHKDLSGGRSERMNSMSKGTRLEAGWVQITSAPVLCPLGQSEQAEEGRLDRQAEIMWLGICYMCSGELVKAPEI